MPYPEEVATLVGSACDVSRERFNVVLAGYHQTSCDKANGTFICSVFDSESNKWRKFDSLVDAHFTRMDKNHVRVSLRGPPLAYRQFLHTPAPFEGSSLEEDDTAWWGRLRGVRARPGNRPLYLLEFEGFFRWFRYQRRGWPSRCCRITIPGGSGIWEIGSVFDARGTQRRESRRSVRLVCMYVLVATDKQILAYQWKNGVWKHMFSVNNRFTIPWDQASVDEWVQDSNSANLKNCFSYDT